MSPLAREQDVDDQESESEKENTKEKQKGLVDRFELIVAKQELINAYSELSDPVEQRRRFEMQVQQRLEVNLPIPPLLSFFLCVSFYLRLSNNFVLPLCDNSQQ